MKKIVEKIPMIMICIGVLMVLGTAGTSDMETATGYIGEQTPFWFSMFMSLGGAFLAGLGILWHDKMFPMRRILR